LIEIGCIYCEVEYDEIRRKDYFRCKINSPYFYMCEKCPHRKMRQN